MDIDYDLPVKVEDAPPPLNRAGRRKYLVSSKGSHGLIVNGKPSKRSKKGRRA